MPAMPAHLGAKHAGNQEELQEARMTLKFFLNYISLERVSCLCDHAIIFLPGCSPHCLGGTKQGVTACHVRGYQQIHWDLTDFNFHVEIFPESEN